MEFILFIAVALLLIFVFKLQGRLEKIEELLKPGLAKMQIKQTGVQTSPSSASLIQPKPPMPSQSIQTNPAWIDELVEWSKRDWLLKLGALLLLIGFGWLASYAFINNWIGPMGRIVLGIIAGILILLFGWWRIKKYLHQGSIFMVLGSTIILLTIFAAREIYGFFTPTSALLVMFLSTVFVAVASVRYKTSSLALSSLVLAGIAPFFTNAPSPNFIGLFFYLFAVVLGTIWIIILTDWRILTTAALILVSAYSLSHLESPISPDRGVLLLFAYAFAAVFFITNTMGLLRLKDKAMLYDLITAGGNGLFLLFWIMSAAPDELRSLIISAWMIVFSAGAFLIFKITQKREPFYVYAGVGVTMLAAATSAELNGAALTIAYTIESAIVPPVVFFTLRDVRVAQYTSLLLIGPLLLSLKNITSSSWLTAVFHQDFFVLFILAAVLLGLGLFFFQLRQQNQEKQPLDLSKLLLITGSIYVYLLLWLSLHAAIANDDTATMISLVIYTIIGLTAYFYGRVNAKNEMIFYGGTLLGLVVTRLLFVDVWKMQLTGRIITFFIIGILLISTAFVGRKKPNV